MIYMTKPSRPIDYKKSKIRMGNVESKKPLNLHSRYRIQVHSCSICNEDVYFIPRPRGSLTHECRGYKLTQEQTLTS